MRKIATREVTAADLALARKLRNELDSAERETTTSKDIAQALVNIRWAIAETLRQYQESVATGK